MAGDIVASDDVYVHVADQGKLNQRIDQLLVTDPRTPAQR